MVERGVWERTRRAIKRDFANLGESDRDWAGAVPQSIESAQIAGGEGERERDGMSQAKFPCSLESEGRRERDLRGAVGQRRRDCVETPSTTGKKADTSGYASKGTEGLVLWANRSWSGRQLGGESGGGGQGRSRRGRGRKRASSWS